MTNFKKGNFVWTWSLTVFGPYIPFFSEYEITNIISSEQKVFALLSHPEQRDMAMPIEFIFKSKNEAINSLIKKLEKMKEE